MVGDQNLYIYSYRSQQLLIFPIGVRIVKLAKKSRLSVSRCQRSPMGILNRQEIHLKLFLSLHRLQPTKAANQDGQTQAELIQETYREKKCEKRELWFHRLGLC